MAWHHALWLGLGGLLPSAAAAFSIQTVTPQGVVQEARQVVVRTDTDAVRLGNAQAADIATVQCTDAAGAQGTGRWNDAREWVWQFERPVPAGVQCTITPKKSFKSPSQQGLTRASSYQFEVAGPSVLAIWPRSYEPVDEQQAFVLQLNAAATAASLQQHVHCQASDVGEQIPVRRLETADTQTILKALDLSEDAQQQPGHYVALMCQRRMTAGSSMQLVYGKGVATAQGMMNRESTHFDFEVRQPFQADVQCERERANTGCLPVRDVRLHFTAPVDVATAKKILLKNNGKSHAAVWDDADGNAIEQLRFQGPFEPLASYTLELPANLQDDSGRALRNASAFPQKVAVGDTPTLAKFAAAPFGVLERFAQGADGGAILPLTVRHIEGSTPASHTTPLHSLRLTRDADIIRWWALVQRYHSGSVARETARRDVAGPLPPAIDNGESPDYVATRTVSLLQGQPHVQTLPMPSAPSGAARPLEVIGIPLQQPGLHVVELQSNRLGQALLDERMGEVRPMWVRTSVLVTNLAVHLKLGREGSAVWVTSLDRGQPVAGAQVQVSDCSGKAHAQGITDAQGLLQLPQLERNAPDCDNHAGSGAWFVSARQGSGADADVAFIWSNWHDGIEPWRFNFPTGWGQAPESVAHSILDRSLVRAGDTVSMRHVVRVPTLQGLAYPRTWPHEMVITHVGSQQQFVQPLNWQTSAQDARHALSQFTVPAAAKLGLYQVALRWKDARDDSTRTLDSGSFRVEAFRLPHLQGSVQPTAPAPLLSTRQLPVAVSLSYLNGGAASGQPVQVSALLRPYAASFERWERFSFESPRPAADHSPAATADAETARLVADKLPLRLDAQGQGHVELPDLPPSDTPQSLVLEASFADPNGEIQTLRSTHTLWPSSVLAGIQTDNWLTAGRKASIQALAINTQGQPQKGITLQVDGVLHTTTTTRKRLVGGFYSYDNQSHRKALGQLCSGPSDAHGLLRCEVPLTEAGEVELIVSAKDAQGRVARTASTLWVSGQGELWFAGQDHDRMDVLPEKPNYQPGETAQLQVRMPFRQATALLTVEREGVLHSQVVQLQGRNPTIALPVQAGWGPNVYVSVLALRGRLYEVPWYSFFTWGYKTPAAWWHAFWQEGKDYVPPTAMVDLSKPAFRLGVAELKVEDPATVLQVQVQADKTNYQVREQARITIRAKLADGSPAAGAEVAVAAVDKALLELSPNRSWQLHDAMWKRRDWNVETSTAQMEIIGRRHYGRKAAPPGGGGGSGAPTRELLDTLLLWNPHVVLDAQGQAELLVPLNDALTRFEVAAVAQSGAQRFGTGSVEIQTTQDLQLISGLPPVVREGDQLTAMLTVRNTTEQPMQVQVTPQSAHLSLPAQTVEIAAQQAQVLQWPVTVPALPASAPESELHWTLEAHDLRTGARDTLLATQRWLPAVPLAVQQSTLHQLDSHWTQALQWPENALPGRGGVRLAFNAHLADPQQGLPGLRDWWAAYPYSCLEQTVGQSIGLSDPAQWQRTMAQLPTYLDADGLALYFPAADSQRPQGSDSLTAHLLALHYAMQGVDARFALPAAERERMESALIGFVQGRVERSHWSPRPDLDVRKLAAVAALAHSGKARMEMLQSIQLTPTQWPTHALIDWRSILLALPQMPQQAQQLEQVQQLLKSRLSYQGSQVSFSTDAQDQWWWLMQGTEVNAARLLLTTLTDSDWDAERARLVTGLLARQKQGHWGTTTANTWVDVALRHFSQRFERDAVTGYTTAVLGAATQTVDWAKPAEPSAAHATAPHSAAHTLELPWGERRLGQLDVQHRGTGKPWVALQSIAAVPRTQALQAGYAVKKTITPVQGAKGDAWQRGDVVRITLQVKASADMAWVALTDPIPAGATLLGSGLGRDSAVATQGEGADDAGASPTFVERGADSFRAYWEYLPEGASSVSYTVRLNNAGDFALPPTRVEAMYAPEMFGELPNPRWKVAAPAP